MGHVAASLALTSPFYDRTSSLYTSMYGSLLGLSAGGGAFPPLGLRPFLPGALSIPTSRTGSQMLLDYAHASSVTSSAMLGGQMALHGQRYHPYLAAPSPVKGSLGSPP